MAQNTPAVLGPVEPSARPHAPKLTSEQVCNIGFAVLRAHNDDRIWRALTYDSGPYDLTTPNLALQELGAAFYAAGCAAGGAQAVDKANSYIVDNARLAEQVENLRAALQWYADGLHFDKASPDAWDTVSGEPQNWWCDEAGTATVEDGSIAAMVLRGELTGAQVQALE